MAGILIVEDERIVALDIEQSLKRFGHTILGIVSSGEEAIQKTAEHHPDLVIMDIKLKGNMDGVAAAEYIGKDFGIPIIFLTAHIDENTLQRAKLTGPLGYLIKPFEEKELHAAVEIALYKYGLELKLKKSEEKFHNIILNNADPILIIDQDGLVRFLNTAGEIFFGRKAECLMGTYLGIPVLGGDKSELEVINPQMGSLTAEIRLVKTQWEGQPAFIASLRDVTERKQMTEKLQEGIQKLKISLRGTVQAVAATVEIRDPYTAGHQQRVSSLARSLAQEMGLPEDQIEGVRMAGIVHDLGKMAVPAEILSKPTKLSDIEFGLIKSHPEVSYGILKDIEFPWPVAQIALQHHERMDGSGYPKGLSGDNILVEARILMVADVVEAIASHRPYRPALGTDVALEEIAKNKGTLYDSEVVDCCLRLFKEKGYVF